MIFVVILVVVGVVWVFAPFVMDASRTTPTSSDTQRVRTRRVRVWDPNAFSVGQLIFGWFLFFATGPFVLLMRYEQPEGRYRWVDEEVRDADCGGRGATDEVADLIDASNRDTSEARRALTADVPDVAHRDHRGDHWSPRLRTVSDDTR